MKVEIVPNWPASTSTTRVVQVLRLKDGQLEQIKGAQLRVTHPEVGDCFVAFSMNGFRLSSQGVAPVAVAAAAASYPPNEAGLPNGEQSQVIELGQLRPGRTVTINLGAYVKADGTGGAPFTLDGGKDVVTFRQGGGRTFDRLGSARLGQVLMVEAKMHFSTCLAASNAVPVAAMARFRPTRASTSVDIQVRYYDLSDPNGQTNSLLLGVATVNSATGRPVKLAIVPNTTRLIAGRPRDCGPARDSKRLPEGLAEAGVDVGRIFGYVPRDPCGGGELVRWLQFEVAVSS